MARYAVNNELPSAGNQQNMSTAFKTLIAMLAFTTPRRGKLYDVAWGASGTPVDALINVDVARQTVNDGTSTTMTPLPLDPADAACSTITKGNYSVEGTVTASTGLLNLPTNIRASYRWVAFPGGELVWPATSANGLAIRAKQPQGTYTSTVGAMAYFEEQ